MNTYVLHPQRKINDSTDLYQWFLSKPNVLQRINKHVVSTDSTHVHIGPAPDNLPHGSFEPAHLTDQQLTGTLASSLSYLYNSEGESVDGVLLTSGSKT